MENKELLEKFKAIVGENDVKEITGTYYGESDEGGVDDWYFVNNNSEDFTSAQQLKWSKEVYELLELAVARFLGEGWYDGHPGLSGEISYSAPSEKNPNGVLTLSQSVKEWTALPNEHIY